MAGLFASPARLCALLRGHCVKRRGHLLNLFAAAIRASHLLSVVVVQRENAFESFMAVLADVIVHGHGTPPVEDAAIVTPLPRSQSCDYFFSLIATDAAVFSQLIIIVHVPPF